MRSYLVLILALAGVLLFDCWGQSQLRSISQQGTEMTLQERQFVEANEWAAALEQLERMKQYLEDRDLLLSTLVEHDRIDILRAQLTELASLLQRHESTLALISLDRLQLAYEDLHDSVRFSWENII